MRRWSPRLAALPVAAALLLAACGGGDDESSDGSSIEPAATSASTEPVATPAPTEPAPTSSPTTEAPATSAAPTTAPAPPPATASCPQGTWIGSSAELQKFYDAIGAASGGTITVRGQVLLELTPDGTVRWTPQDWGITATFAGVASDASLTGTISGTYTVDGDMLTTTNVDNQLEVQVTVNGVAIDAQGALAEAFAEFPINDSTYACTADGLVLGLRNVSDGFTDVLFVPA